MKRSIKLKEYAPLSRQLRWPADAYLAGRTLDRDKAYHAEYDADGFETCAPVSNSDKRLFLLGASCIENLYCDQHHRIAQTLQRELFANSLDYRVLNGGYSGATTLALLNTLINKILKFRKPIVFFEIPASDLFAFALREKYWSQHRYFGNLAPTVDRVPAGVQQAEDLATLENLILTIRDVGRNFGMKILFGNMINNFSDANTQEVNARLVDIFTRHHLDHIDFKRYEKALQGGFYDANHLNEAGSEVMGKIIFENLLAHGYLTRAPDRGGLLHSFKNTLRIRHAAGGEHKIVIRLKKPSTNLLLDGDQDAPCLQVSRTIGSTDGRPTDITIGVNALQRLSLEDLDIDLDPASRLSLALDSVPREGRRPPLFLLKSFHGSFLVFDGRTRDLGFAEEIGSETTPIVGLQHEDGFSLRVLCGETLHGLGHAGGFRLQECAVGEDALQLERCDEQGFFYLRNPAGCKLTANPDRSYLLQVRHLRDWEKFRPFLF